MWAATEIRRAIQAIEELARQKRVANLIALGEEMLARREMGLE